MCMYFSPSPGQVNPTIPPLLTLAMLSMDRVPSGALHHGLPHTALSVSVLPTLTLVLLLGSLSLHLFPKMQIILVAAC